MNNISFLGLGSNIGDKKQNIFNAIKLLDSHPKIKVLEKSKLYSSPPYGFHEQESFINSVIKIATELTVEALFTEVKNIEKTLGRKPTFRWGPRVIDIDILFYNDEIINTKDITIPHPDLHNRAFVLVPLVEIESELLHPVLKKTAYQLMMELSVRELNSLKIAEGG